MSCSLNGYNSETTYNSGIIEKFNKTFEKEKQNGLASPSPLIQAIRYIPLYEKLPPQTSNLPANCDYPVILAKIDQARLKIIGNPSHRNLGSEKIKILNTLTKIHDFISENNESIKNMKTQNLPNHDFHTNLFFSMVLTNQEHQIFIRPENPVENPAFDTITEL